MVEQRILEIIKKTLDRNDITLESTFDELGVDSLDAIEVLFEIEDEFNIDIPDWAAKSIRSVREVIDGVEKLIAGEELERPESAELPTSNPGDVASEAG